LQNKETPIGKVQTPEIILILKFFDILLRPFQQLIDAVTKQDVALVLQLLSHSKAEDVNTCVSPADKRTSLHVAASIPNTVLTQLLIWVFIFWIVLRRKADYQMKFVS
jgi:hypothetical protein